MAARQLVGGQASKRPGPERGDPAPGSACRRSSQRNEARNTTQRGTHTESDDDYCLVISIGRGRAAGREMRGSRRRPDVDVRASGRSVRREESGVCSFGGWSCRTTDNTRNGEQRGWSYLGRSQVAEARVRALDGRLLDDARAEAARPRLPVAHVARADAVLALVEAVRPALRPQRAPSASVSMAGKC